MPRPRAAAYESGQCGVPPYILLVRLTRTAPRTPLKGTQSADRRQGQVRPPENLSGGNRRLHSRPCMASSAPRRQPPDTLVALAAALRCRAGRVGRWSRRRSGPCGMTVIKNNGAHTNRLDTPLPAGLVAGARRRPVRPRSAVGIPGPTSESAPWPAPPTRRGWPLHLQPDHHIRPQTSRDPAQQLALQGTQLGGPRRRASGNGELAVPQADRGGVLRHIRAYQLGPPAEHRGGGDPVLPALVHHQPGGQPAQRLRVPVIRPGTGPGPPPAPPTRPPPPPLSRCPRTMPPGSRRALCGTQRLPRQVRAGWIGRNRVIHRRYIGWILFASRCVAMTRRGGRFDGPIPRVEDRPR